MSEFTPNVFSHKKGRYEREKTIDDSNVHEDDFTKDDSEEYHDSNRQGIYGIYGNYPVRCGRAENKPGCRHDDKEGQAEDSDEPLVHYRSPWDFWF